MQYRPSRGILRHISGQRQQLIGSSVHYNYLRRGRKTEKPEFVQFLEVVEEALARSGARCVAPVQQAALNGDWKVSYRGTSGSSSRPYAPAVLANRALKNRPL